MVIYIVYENMFWMRKVCDQDPTSFPIFQLGQIRPVRRTGVRCGFARLGGIEWITTFYSYKVINFKAAVSNSSTIAAICLDVIVQGVGPCIGVVLRRGWNKKCSGSLQYLN